MRGTTKSRILKAIEEHLQDNEIRAFLNRAELSITLDDGLITFDTFDETIHLWGNKSHWETKYEKDGRKFGRYEWTQESINIELEDPRGFDKMVEFGRKYSGEWPKDRGRP